MKVWARVGLGEDTKKRVDEALNEKVQGMMIYGAEHPMALSIEKKFAFLASGIWLLTHPSPAFHALDRTQGKVGYAETVFPCLRSLFVRFYVVLEQGRSSRAHRFARDWGSWMEMTMSLMLLDDAVLDFALPWCSRVEYTGAAPGGWGRAYATVPVELVALTA